MHTADNRYVERSTCRFADYFPAGWVIVCLHGENSRVHPVCPSQIAIPVVSVTHIKKTKTAILVPNALVISTANDRVRQRFLHLISWWWKHPVNCSPAPKTPEHNMTVVLLVAVCVRVLPVQRQHLQVPDVRLSASGGRADFPTCGSVYVLCHCNQVELL